MGDVLGAAWDFQTNVYFLAIFRVKIITWTTSSSSQALENYCTESPKELLFMWVITI